MKDTFTIEGKLRFILTDSHGTTLFDKEDHNLIVNTGKAQVASFLAGTSTAHPLAVAVGTDSTVPTITNTALGAEIARVAVTSATSSSATVTYIADLGAAVGTGTILEAGLFSSVTALAGVLFSRSTSLSVVKGPTDILQIIWTITVT